MGYIVKKNISHDEWLRLRYSGIGSSEVGALFGVSSFDTPLTIYNKKLGLTPPEPENERMTMGHILEPSVAEGFAQMTGAVIMKSSEGDWMAVDRKRPYLRASPDRIYFEAGAPHTRANRRICECKSTVLPVSRDWYPKSWYYQIMYQMGVMGITAGVIAWIRATDHGFERGYVDVPFEYEVYKEIVRRIDDIWLNHILKGIPPEPITMGDYSLLYPRHEDGKYTGATDDVKSMLRKMNDIDRDIKPLKDEKDELQEKIKMFIAGNEGINDPVYGTLCTYKTGKDKEEFDASLTEKFRTEHPRLYREYFTTKSGSRTFKLNRKSRLFEASETENATTL